jgi:hypothetical protein
MTHTLSTHPDTCVPTTRADITYYGLVHDLRAALLEVAADAEMYCGTRSTLLRSLLGPITDLRVRESLVHNIRNLGLAYRNALIDHGFHRCEPPSRAALDEAITDAAVRAINATCDIVTAHRAGGTS